MIRDKEKVDKGITITNNQRHEVDSLVKTDDDIDKTQVLLEVVERNQRLLYKATDHPPIHITIFCAFQHTLISLTGAMAVSLLVADVTCANADEEIKTMLISSTFVMSGICTVLMSLIGSRLPLFQGAAGEFLIPFLAMQIIDPTKCDMKQTVDQTDFNGSTSSSNVTSSAMSDRNMILNNLQDMQGSLIAAGTFQFLIGATGIISILLKFIGPITIVPTLFLSVVFITRACVKFSSHHWGVALMVACVSLLLSLYLAHHKTPIPLWTRRKGFHIFWFPLHQVYSLLIGILFGWIVSAILTSVGVYGPDEIYSRTDSRLYVVHDAKWFRVPYPGQFGRFSFSTSIFVGFMIGTITSILDSIGDYYACAKMCNVPPPPAHSVNRGIAVEGFCSILAGFLGCGHATTTLGGNIGAIGVTKVASRDVFIVAGIIYLIFGIIGKISAIFLLIPYPVLGGAIIVMFGMFNGVVLSNLDVVSLSSSRNLAIIGTSILFGLMIPHWLETTPGAISTGSERSDAVIKMLLANPNLCGGVTAFFLDNTVRGTLEERGIAAWQKMIDDKADSNAIFDCDVSLYDIYLPKRLKKSKIIRFLPFMPTYSK